MYRPVDPKASFPLMEEKVLEFWEKNDIFQKSISQREGNEEFVFYDGPPFATGCLTTGISFRALSRMSSPATRP